MFKEITTLISIFIAIKMSIEKVLISTTNSNSVTITCVIVTIDVILAITIGIIVIITISTIMTNDVYFS